MCRMESTEERLPFDVDAEGRLLKIVIKLTPTQPKMEINISPTVGVVLCS